MCLIHKHSNLQEWCNRFFRKYFSVATTKIRLRGSTLSHTQQHIRIPEPPSHGSGCFSNFGQSQKYFILIGCFLGPGSYVKNVELKQFQCQTQTSGWTERWQAGGAQLSPWGPLCISFVQINSSVCALFVFIVVINFILFLSRGAAPPKPLLYYTSHLAKNTHKVHGWTNYLALVWLGLFYCPSRLYHHQTYRQLEETAVLSGQL